MNPIVWFLLLYIIALHYCFIVSYVSLFDFLVEWGKETLSQQDVQKIKRDLKNIVSILLRKVNKQRGNNLSRRRRGNRVLEVFDAKGRGGRIRFS